VTHVISHLGFSFIGCKTYHTAASFRNSMVPDHANADVAVNALR
jgi:hypothetical protein